MKKAIILMILCVFAFTTANAQFKVSTNGKIGIGTSYPQYRCDLNIGTSDAFRIYTWTNTYMDNSGDCGGLCFYPQMGYYLQLGKNLQEVGQIWACEIHNIWSLEYSDFRLKENIRPISNPLQRLQQINGIQYNMKADRFENYPPLKKEEYTRDEYGFIAQELQEVFPEVVVPDEDGILSVKYTRMIPILVEAIKEQQLEIDSLKLVISGERALLMSRLNELQTAIEQRYNNSMSDFSTMTNTSTILQVEQNSPNPYSEITNINCYISENVQNVQLCIYDLRGTLQKCISIRERGNVTVQVPAGELSSGIYAYLLKGDGHTSDAKQMIITR
ncbi:MAG: tail fiber domain-containing protein [Bacteroidales bacterium]|nr:tail fiber domain-containing protein [Bacteroidales bacterium]